MKNLSIIIPLGPGEDQVHHLLEDLYGLPEAAEIIIVSCDDANKTTDARVRRITSAQGRAIQQNAGAKAAKGDFLWFLHADTRLTPQAFVALAASLQKAPQALHYFHLKFSNDGPRGMWLNEWGARVRSGILGIPFGDQGFCLGKDSFTKVGGFSEHTLYGEDHLLVWHVRQAGLKLRCTGTALKTSARKYRHYGHIVLMVKYQRRWLKQAAPEFLKLLRLKWKDFVKANGEWRND